MDEAGFKAAMEEQRVKARNARKTTNYMGADVTVYQEIDPAITSVFVGYDKLVNESKISVMTTEEEITNALTEGQNGTIIVDETVFYATMGGQEGDKGTISNENGTFKVEETIKLQGGKVGHVGHMTQGVLKINDVVTMEVCKSNRDNTCKNHSATHLLQKALRTVLGSHVEQQGSLVTNDRLRFDFSHFQALSKEELEKVEAIVNEQIIAALPVVTQVMNIEEAKKTGAMALFGEKYADDVRVVSMGDFSIELCGGTHVANTSSIMLFKIVSEAGIAAGVRRIEALTGMSVLNYYKNVEKELHDTAKVLKAEPGMLVKKVEALQDELKTLSSENESLKNKLANSSLGDVLNNVIEVKGVKLLATSVDNVDMNSLSNLGDQLKEKIGECVIVLASKVAADKVNLIVMATDECIKKGAHAGNLIKELATLVGGGGGGRPNMAQAGGKNPDGIAALIEQAKEALNNQIA